MFSLSSVDTLVPSSRFAQKKYYCQLMFSWSFIIYFSILLPRTLVFILYHMIKVISNVLSYFVIFCIVPLRNKFFRT